MPSRLEQPRRLLHQDLVDLVLPDDEELTWQAEAQVSIRGLPILMHEQTAAHYCPILIEKRRPDDPADRPVPLVTTYLSTKMQRTEQVASMRYTRFGTKAAFPPSRWRAAAYLIAGLVVSAIAVSV